MDGVEWDVLRGRAVLLTGATGFVGGALVRSLVASNLQRSLGMRILAQGRNEERGRALAELPGVEFLSGDIRGDGWFPAVTNRIDHVLHCVAITRSADMVARADEVRSVILDGTANALRLAGARECRSFVNLSSMEAYGQAVGEVSEEQLGPLDLSNPRSSYPQAKREAEALCRTYADSFDVRSARLGLTFGAEMSQNPTDGRVALQFARAALAGRDIVLHTAGRSVTNVVETTDAVRALLLLLTRGESGLTYNVANPASAMTIRQMAETLAREVCEGRIKVVVETPTDHRAAAYAPDSGFTLNVDRIRSLGWEPRYGMADMFRRMLANTRIALPAADGGS